uniref:C-type lectin domain-containing protein n=1 Tax=Poecilia reticulata TaxID=8081 RepID=A0A3P9NBV9_POERE
VKYLSPVLLLLNFYTVSGVKITLIVGCIYLLSSHFPVDICVGCQEGWTWFEGRCFHYVATKMSWGDAEKFCLTSGANLASFHTYNFIRQLVLSSSKTNASSWIGGHDSAEEGNWLWSDGSKFLFHHWGKGQPNNANGNEDCMEINFTGIYYWKIATCNFII